MERGSLAGSGIPLWCRLPFARPAGRSGGAPELGRGGLESKSWGGGLAGEQELGRGGAGERASGRTEEGWGWASDLSDSSDSSDRARPHPKTPGCPRYAIIYIRPRQGVAPSGDRHYDRPLAGSRGLSETSISRDRRGYAPPTPGPRKTHPSGVPLADLPRLPPPKGRGQPNIKTTCHFMIFHAIGIKFCRSMT